MSFIFQSDLSDCLSDFLPRDNGCLFLFTTEGEEVSLLVLPPEFPTSFFFSEKFCFYPKLTSRQVVYVNIFFLATIFISVIVISIIWRNIVISVCSGMLDPLSTFSTSSSSSCKVNSFFPVSEQEIPLVVAYFATVLYKEHIDYLF